MNAPDHDFNQVIANGWTDPTPYAEPTPVKPGLTPRGKAALAIGGAVLAGGAIVGYQAHTSAQADRELAARELALEEKRLDLEQRRLETETAAQTTKAHTKAETARQTAVEDCIKDRENKVGQGLGAPTYRELTDVCTAIHTPAIPLDDMQPAAATDTVTDTTDDGGNGLLIGGAVLAGGVLLATRKARKNVAD
ncbi:hypothetical protein [Streptomyces chilikensis]|uniref:LPXTG cell wall anchor domain-containing protein n=1 Tax=Streptomyces chilikensis TaxID=1194079 RepID=A0ABV3ERN8_9ACTN